jgi:hypothetical protein
MFFPGGTGSCTLVSSSDEDDNRSIGQEILNSYEETAKERGLQNVRMLLEMGDAAQRIIETASEVELVLSSSNDNSQFFLNLPSKPLSNCLVLNLS